MPRSRSRKSRTWPNKILLGVAGLAMVATWIYGFLKGGIVMGLIAIPVGIGVAICTMAAFTYPLIMAVATICGALTGIDRGPIQMFRGGAAAFLAVGAACAAIYGIRYLVRRGWLR